MNPEQPLEIYFLELKPGKMGLFTPSDAVERFEHESDDRIRRGLNWLSSHRYRLIAWIGRVFRSGHGYYVRFEAKIDPVERVLKTLGSATHYIVVHSPARDPHLLRGQFFRYVRRQRFKHLFWCVLDLLLSIASLALAALPGPNVLGWYPFLRSLSHYAAFSGTRNALNAGGVEFKGLPELRTLEENLQAPGFDRKRIHAIVEDLRISGLEQYLERMV